MAYIYLFNIILLDTTVILVCRNLIQHPPHQIMLSLLVITASFGVIGRFNMPYLFSYEIDVKYIVKQSSHFTGHKDLLES